MPFSKIIGVIRTSGLNLLVHYSVAANGGRCSPSAGYSVHLFVPAYSFPVLSHNANFAVFPIRAEQNIVSFCCHLFWS